jgi:hypothetical protein
MRSRLLEALIAEHGTPEMKAAVSSQLSCSISSLLFLLEFFPIPLHKTARWFVPQLERMKVQYEEECAELDSKWKEKKKGKKWRELDDDAL